MVVLCGHLGIGREHARNRAIAEATHFEITEGGIGPARIIWERSG